MLTHLKATTRELFSQPSLKGTRAGCVTQKEICGSCSSRRRPRVRDCGFLVETAAIANQSPGRARMGGNMLQDHPLPTFWLPTHTSHWLNPNQKKAESKPAELRFLEGREVRRDESESGRANRWSLPERGGTPGICGRASRDLTAARPGFEAGVRCQAWSKLPPVPLPPHPESAQNPPDAHLQGVTRSRINVSNTWHSFVKRFWWGR